MKVLLVLALALWASSAFCDVVTTGEGLLGLSFQGAGKAVLGTGNNLRQSLSANLPATFTFELWFSSPNTKDGSYKPILSRFQKGNDGQYHNRWSDFVFQVQADGTLNLFAGNGFAVGSPYGFNLGTIILDPNVWHHAAFSLTTLPGQRSASSARIFINGLEFAQLWSGVGNRQHLRNQPLYLGSYQNQGGESSWKGALDEVRFWAGYRTFDQLNNWGNSAVPFGDTSGIPLAYYRFNDGAGLLTDSSPFGFHGSASGAISASLSGVKINPVRAINHTEARVFTLPGSSVNGTFGFTYVITSLPTDGDGNVVGGLITPEGVQINTVPFALLANQVVYQAPPNVNCDITFSYYGRTPLVQETQSTSLTIMVGDEPCISKECGRCQDSPRVSLLNLSKCTCLGLPFFGYQYTDVERIVFLFEIEKTLDLMSQLESKLERILRQLTRYPASADLVVLINEVQAFNRGCLRQFCENFTSLLAKVSAAPQPEISFEVVL